MQYAALACAGLVGLTAGGVRTWTVPCLAVAALVACARSERRLSPLHVLLLGAAVWQTLLVMPLPVGAASLLSPHYADTRAFVWQALVAPPSWAPLAVNPAVAALDAARLWSTLLLSLTVTGRRAVPLAIVAIGLAQLVLGGFVNPNHQAAFWNMGWLCALHTSFNVREQWQRAGLTIAAAVLVAGVAATGSRAGVVAGGLGGLVLAWRMRPRAAVVLFFLALGAVIAQGIDFRLRAEEKTRVWANALTVVTDYPLGTGRGGFGLVFPSVREPDRERGRWDYVENEYIQALVDYGPIGGALALIAFAWVILGTRHHLAVLVALAAQAVFDFNWELAGVFLPAWLLMSSAAQAPPFGKGIPARAVWWAALVCLPGLVYYGVSNDPDRLDAEQLVRTRPLDSWAHVTLATQSLATDPQTALRWLNRAVYVDHDWKQPHITLARLFCAAGLRAQGRTELKLAEDRSGDDGRDPAAIPLLLKCIDTPGDEMDLGERALPAVITALRADKREDSLEAIATLYTGNDPAVLGALALWRGGLQSLATVYKTDERIAARYVELLLADGRIDEAQEANAFCGERERQLNRARIAAKQNKPNEATSIYKLWLTREPNDKAAQDEARAYERKLSGGL